MFKFYQTIVSIILLSVFFSSCDFIAAGSNLMAERYEFDVTQDSLIKKITAYNNMTLQDSLFKISANSPYFYKGYVNDEKNNDIYWVLIPVPADPPTELLLLSVENKQSGERILVNNKPENKTEIRDRKIAIENFKNRVLDNLGLRYKHTGNAMNKVY
ncbi:MULTISPECIES: hypothetical protein [Sphingobacterium]|uniref:hypothetical protein n=1 Tax=Sphingobacterium TaxID=28453 RepID=UPI0028B16A9A|nr:hypothetical protein [Sphingobacterium siyangense]